MIAYVTSIGEPTTQTCIWALKRNGFEVLEIIDDNTSLSMKLEAIYGMANQDFVRIDADVVVNKTFTPKLLSIYAGETWWWQFQCYDWFKQDLGYGGIQFIREQALPFLRDSVDRFQDAERPETELSRIEDFYNPRRFESVDKLVGLNNYKNDINRVRATKERRGQTDYDWELAQRLNEL